MSLGGFDPSLTQDFLTESSELIEQLDRDLVTLERTPAGAQSQELLNGVFRALHTIKGAAGFLKLTEVTHFAHAAEDALNRLRKGEASLTPRTMDALLRSADVVRGMIGQVAQGQPVTPGPADLVATLTTIASGSAESTAPAAAPTATAEAAAPAESGTAMDLPKDKADLIEFMAADLHEVDEQLARAIAQLGDDRSLAAGTAQLAEVASNLGKTADFFGLAGLVQVAALLAAAAAHAADLPREPRGEVLARLGGLRRLIQEQTSALSRRRALTWPLDTLSQRLHRLLAGQGLPADLANAHGGDSRKVLELDAVISGPAAGTAGPVAAPATGPAPAAEAARAGVADTTIRVEVSRLENLLNLVGQLVLSKNRVVGLGRRLRDRDLPHELTEEVNSATAELDRLTGELQVGVMRTRMQPLAKLFERYPRVIRDIARAGGKQIDLVITGKETEVDKSVLELLADPLVHMLRNSADHGIESPQRRQAAGKPATGVIHLHAEHQGSHVRVEIRDDGKGLDRQAIGRKALEKGLTTPEQLAQMSDDQVFQFIFAAGLSTVEKVTDLSGRGVGMDVVRTNITRLNGVINLASTPGQGTMVEILIPLTVAILPAMVVGVGRALYTIPLKSIVEIVRPGDQALHSVVGRPVMRLRDQVLPLVDLRQRLSETEAPTPNRFAVVVGVGQERVGLLVDRLIGQQEAVIKPLDDHHAAGGPFSGATIREDGSISLILDVIQLIRGVQQTAHRAAA